MTAIVVLEIGRPISDSVKSQFGHVDEVISYPRAIDVQEYASIIKAAYAALRKYEKDEITLVLSGPLGLSFQLGQVVGLSHFKVIVYQFQNGTYVPIPPITREVMF